MKYLTIDNEYLTLLRNNENKIPYQEYGKYKYKPFIGPLFEKDRLVYVTHLTHYDDSKHSNILPGSGIKHIVSDLSGNPTSVINLAGMFPVPHEAITEVRYNELEKIREFRSEAEKFKFERFMKIQMKSIKTLNLVEHSKNLYARKEVFNDRDFCIDYKKLEKVANNWMLQKNQTELIIKQISRKR